MSGDVRHYMGADIEVSYDPRRCIHAAECVRGLPQVFNAAERPWIQPAAAAAEAIAAVIERCPSGALHYNRLDDGLPEAAMEPATILATANGPLYVRGHLALRSTRSDLLVEETRVALCRCGHSRNKPFCDNSHIKV